MSSKNEIGVKYIGRRNPWTDRIYSTGLSFEPTQVRYLSGEVAQRLLRHKDLFAEFTADDADNEGEDVDTNANTDEDKPDEDDTAALLEAQAKKDAEAQAKQVEKQQLYDQINQMEDKAAIQNFALENYGHKISKVMTEENMRAEAIGLIDQFGVV